MEPIDANEHVVSSSTWYVIAEQKTHSERISPILICVKQSINFHMSVS